MSVSTHTADATPQTQVCEQRPDPIVPYDTVAGIVSELIDAQNENDRQNLLVFNPSPEHDSIVERIGHQLREDPELIALIREWVASNRKERTHVREATGPADLIARTLAVQPDRQGLGIKTAAAMLREPLKVIRAGRTDVVEAKAYFLACCTVKDVIGQMPVATLRGASMRERLGSTRERTGLHDVLCDLLTDGKRS